MLCSLMKCHGNNLHINIDLIALFLNACMHECDAISFQMTLSKVVIYRDRTTVRLNLTRT